MEAERHATARVAWLSRLGVRPPESGLVAWIGTTFLVIQSTHALGANAADALFFARFGVDRLPAMIAWSGLAVMAVIVAHASGLSAWGSTRWLWVVSAVGSIWVVVERLAIGSGSQVVYPVIWISTQALIMVTYTVMWNAAGASCTTTQAKRLFPLFATAGVVGAVVGNLLTGPLADRLGTENLLWAQGVILALSALMLRRAAAYFRDEDAGPTRFREQAAAAIKTVASSRLFRFAAVVGFALSALFFLVVFPFNEAVAASFGTEAEIATFLGLFASLATASTFLVSLFATNRLFRRLGLVVSLMLVPIIYLGGFGLWMAEFGLVTAALVRGLQWVAVNAIQGTAYPALFNVVSGRRRAQVMAFMTAVPVQIGTIVAGLVLLVTADLSRMWQFGVGLGVALVALVVVLAMRPAYVDAVVTAVRRGLVGVFDLPASGLVTPTDRDVSRAVVAALDDERPEARALAVSSVSRLSVADAATRVEHMLDDSSSVVRAAAFDTICVVEPEMIADHATKALSDESPEVRLRALHYLKSLAPDSRPEVVARALEDGDPVVRAAAAAVIGGDLGRSAMRAILESDHPGAMTAALKELATDNIGIDPAVFLSHESPKVRAAAIGAYAAGSGRSLEPIRRLLEDPSLTVRHTAAQALATTSQGREIMLDVLQVGSVRASEEALRALTPMQRFTPEFTDWAAQEAGRASKLNSLSISLQSSELSPACGLLVDTLRMRADRLIGWVLMAMTTEETSAIMPVVEKGVASDDEETRSQAIEALETVGARTVLSVLTPLLDPGMPTGQGGRRDALESLVGDFDDWLRALATKVLAEEIQSELTHLGQTAESDRSDLVRRVGPSVTGVTETQPEVLGTMDRVIALHSVPMFSELDPEDLELLAARTIEIRHLPEDRIYSDGDQGDEMLVIIDGEAVVTKLRDSGRELIRRLGPGDHVGELALLGSDVRVADVNAGDAGLVGLVVTKADLLSALEERPGVALGMLRTLALRLARST